MKINADSIGTPASAIERQTAVPSARPQGGPADASAVSSDRLQLSGDVQMIRSAIDTAASLPDIRQDVVERMKAMLADCTLGTDAERLASAILERWLTTP